MTKRIIIPVFACITVCLYGCGHKNAAGGNEIPEIQVAEAITDSLTLYKSYPGTLSATNVVEVVGRVNGTLLSSNFSAGDLVHKGDVLFTIESETYRNAVAEAEAQLATAKSSNEYATRQYAAMKKALESDAVSQMEVAEAKKLSGRESGSYKTG